ncbi:MAG: class I SAM-dependent methyltransferase [Thermosynechococcaceae cyanobacterium]
MKSIYIDGEYLDNNKDWHLEHSPWKAEKIQEILSQNQISFDSLVEVGCGAGGILYELTKYYRDADIEGFDISPQVEDLWNQLPENSINLQVKDFLKSDKFYDVLLLIDVFEHIPDYLDFLNSITSRSKHFIFHIPLDMNVQGLLRELPIRHRNTVGHLHYFSKSTAIRTLEDSGFKIIDCFYTAEDLELKTSFNKRLLAPVRKVSFKLKPDLTVKLLGGWSLMVLAQASEHSS